MNKEKQPEKSIDEIVKDETAQSKAVSSLIDVKPKKEGELGSDIELKTDLTENETKFHTVIDLMSFILSMKSTDFTSKQILDKITILKERKLLSKDRKSRQEIVEVARAPDMTVMGADTGTGAVRRFFTSHKNQMPK